MNSKPYSCALLLGSALLGACGDEAGQSATSELSSTEANIEAAADSQSAAREAAKACFDTFKVCQASAPAGDTSCRAALEACLPEAPPAPECPAQGSDRDAGADSDAGTVRDAGEDTDEDTDESIEESASEGDAGLSGGRSRGDREPRPAPTGDGGVASSDAGWPDHFGARGDHHGRGGRGGPGGSGHGCGRVELPPGALRECVEKVRAAVQSGDSAAAEAAHQACVTQAFADKLSKLCTRAAELCSEPSAPTELCTRITTACGSLTQSDAGI